MSIYENPHCCDRFMVRVTEEHLYWDCQECGTRRNADGDPVNTAQITDYKPKCWNCGRVLGKYFSRPWSIRCHRCKATNQAVLKGD